MNKITFLGAGSTVFAKNVLGDCMQTDSLREFEYALYDIDPKRLEESYQMLSNINRNSNGGRAKLVKYTDRLESLRGAKYVLNAIQVGGYDPCTITDFEIPKHYGLRQTIGDTMGIGGIFRALRTIPVMLDFVHDMEKVCPDALFINYSNPMAMLTLAMLKSTPVQTVGLCHSVQSCVPELMHELGLSQEGVEFKIAGINHMAWLLEITRNGQDIYPAIRKRAMENPIFSKYEITPAMLERYAEYYTGTPKSTFTVDDNKDMVRFEIMKQFGYFPTESSEHCSEYLPYFIKKDHPELIERYQIPLDEYMTRCVAQIKRWKKDCERLVHDENLTHAMGNEYPPHIMNAMETGKPFSFAGNVLNNGSITNLPPDCCVEVTCEADKNGIHPCRVGTLPHQLAALNMSNVNVQLLTVDAALTGKREYIYQAALLDPHAGSELTIDEIHSMVDELIAAHGDWLPKYH